MPTAANGAAPPITLSAAITASTVFGQKTGEPQTPKSTVSI